MSDTCPECGHPLIRHADEAGNACTACQREANPFTHGKPRTQSQICRLSSKGESA